MPEVTSVSFRQSNLSPSHLPNLLVGLHSAGCLAAGSRSASLSVSCRFCGIFSASRLLWDSTEPKHRKQSQLGEWLLKCTPNTDKHKYRCVLSEICPTNSLFRDVCLSGLLHRAGLTAGLRFPRSDPKALRVGLTAPAYSTFGLEFAHLLRAWSAGEARAKMCKLTLHSVLSKGLTKGCAADVQGYLWRARGAACVCRTTASNIWIQQQLPEHVLEWRPESFTVLLFFDHIMEKLSSITFQAAKCPASSTFCLSAHGNFISPEL